jgi:hypothetical protein
MGGEERLHPRGGAEAAHEEEALADREDRREYLRFPVLSVRDVGVDRSRRSNMVIDKTVVAKRLKAIRAVAETDHKQFVGRLGIGLADWNSYEGARMLLSPQVAAKLVQHVPGLTLDWIYLGRTNGLDADLHGKLAKAEEGAGKAA